MRWRIKIQLIFMSAPHRPGSNEADQQSANELLPGLPQNIQP